MASVSILRPMDAAHCASSGGMGASSAEPEALALGGLEFKAVFFGHGLDPAVKLLHFRETGGYRETVGGGEDPVVQVGPGLEAQPFSLFENEMRCHCKEEGAEWVALPHAFQ